MLVALWRRVKVLKIVNCPILLLQYGRECIKSVVITKALISASCCSSGGNVNSAIIMVCKRAPVVGYIRSVLVQGSLGAQKVPLR
mmetsp:Transcript_19545/g.42382  ORF Transcript_19545/g.42382 Transcript_19545/m.42382 type:complete len:85 (-) Transcript_19545:1488-1742(-)